MNSADIAANSITSIKIPDGQVTSSDLADNSVTTQTPPPNCDPAVDPCTTTSKLADNAVTITCGGVAGSGCTSKLADNAVISTKIQDGQVNSQDIAANTKEEGIRIATK